MAAQAPFSAAGHIFSRVRGCVQVVRPVSRYSKSTFHRCPAKLRKPLIYGPSTLDSWSMAWPGLLYVHPPNCLASMDLTTVSRARIRFFPISSPSFTSETVEGSIHVPDPREIVTQKTCHNFVNKFKSSIT